MSSFSAGCQCALTASFLLSLVAGVEEAVWDRRPVMAVQGGSLPGHGQLDGAVHAGRYYTQVRLLVFALR
jgi:hypothetical protein